MRAFGCFGNLARAMQCRLGLVERMTVERALGGDQELGALRGGLIRRRKQTAMSFMRDMHAPSLFMPAAGKPCRRQTRSPMKTPRPDGAIHRGLVKRARPSVSACLR